MEFVEREKSAYNGLWDEVKVLNEVACGELAQRTCQDLADDGLVDLRRVQLVQFEKRVIRLEIIGSRGDILLQRGHSLRVEALVLQKLVNSLVIHSGAVETASNAKRSAIPVP